MLPTLSLCPGSLLGYCKLLLLLPLLLLLLCPASLHELDNRCLGYQLLFCVEHEAEVDMLVCYSNALICAEAQAFVPKHHLLSVLVLVACFAA